MLKHLMSRVVKTVVSRSHVISIFPDFYDHQADYKFMWKILQLWYKTENSFQFYFSIIAEEECYCNDAVYKVNFKFSLSSVFYIEEMLTIICNSSNGLYFVYLFAVDHSFHCNLDLETCPDLETCLELVLLPNYIDLSYRQ